MTFELCMYPVDRTSHGETTGEIKGGDGTYCLECCMGNLHLRHKIICSGREPFCKIHELAFTSGVQGCIQACNSHTILPEGIRFNLLTELQDGDLQMYT